MLVLSRKLGEKIVINKDVVVTVVEMRGDRVRLGIDAPKDVVIVRSELLARAAEEAANKAKGPGREGSGDTAK